MDAAIPLRHRPSARGLDRGSPPGIESAADGSTRRCRCRTRPGSSRDAAPAASGGRSRGSAARPTASTQACPEAAHRLSFLARTIVELAERRRCRSGVRRHIGPKPRQGLRFLENPRQLAAAGGRNAVQARRPARDRGGTRRPRHPRAGADPSSSASSASTSLARMRPEASLSRYRDSDRNGSHPAVRRALDRLFERQVFEGVQRVVMDEDADRPLRGQQVRQPIDERPRGDRPGTRSLGHPGGAWNCHYSNINIL